MNKQKALRILSKVRRRQIANIDFCKEYELEDNLDDYQDFITVYHNLGINKDLVWCNTVQEAKETIQSLDKHSDIALEISDDFYE